MRVRLRSSSSVAGATSSSMTSTPPTVGRPIPRTMRYSEVSGAPCGVLATLWNKPAAVYHVSLMISSTDASNTIKWISTSNHARKVS